MPATSGDGLPAAWFGAVPHPGVAREALQHGRVGFSKSERHDHRVPGMNGIIPHTSLLTIIAMIAIIAIIDSIRTASSRLTVELGVFVVSFVAVVPFVV